MKTQCRKCKGSGYLLTEIGNLASVQECSCQKRKTAAFDFTLRETDHPGTLMLHSHAMRCEYPVRVSALSEEVSRLAREWAEMLDPDDLQLITPNDPDQ